MKRKKNIFVIIGSASKNSANEMLMVRFAELTKAEFTVTIFNELKSLPHFDPDESIHHPPESIVAFRREIERSDGIIICTPEYVFSIPSGLKNAIEWCVSTTVFSDKPVGLITASASGQKGHEELQLIMKTVMAAFNEATTLLIHGIRGKMDQQGSITNLNLKNDLEKFANGFKALMNTSASSAIGTIQSS